MFGVFFKEFMMNRTHRSPSPAMLAAAAVTILSALTINAQTIISNETLATTTFVVNTKNTVARCNKAGCAASAPILTAIPVTCPAAIGATCTFHISFDAKVAIELLCSNCGGGSDVLDAYQFLIDGQAPAPGPTDAAGHYSFDFDTYTAAGLPTKMSIPASVVGVVTNSTSQSHTIDVKVGCADVLKIRGCGVEALNSTMRVDVFEP